MNYQALVHFSLILITTIRASNHLALFYTEVQIHINNKTKYESYEL